MRASSRRKAGRRAMHTGGHESTWEQRCEYLPAVLCRHVPTAETTKQGSDSRRVKGSPGTSISNRKCEDCRRSAAWFWYSHFNCSTMMKRRIAFLLVRL